MRLLKSTSRLGKAEPVLSFSKIRDDERGEAKLEKSQGCRVTKARELKEQSRGDRLVDQQTDHEQERSVIALRDSGQVVTIRGSDAGWSSLAARRAHNPKVAGSNPAPATRFSSEGPLRRPFCRESAGCAITDAGEADNGDFWNGPCAHFFLAKFAVGP